MLDFQKLLERLVFINYPAALLMQKFILNSSFKQSIFEEKLRRKMQEAAGSASKFFKKIFTKKTKLKDEFKMNFSIVS